MKKLMLVLLLTLSGAQAFAVINAQSSDLSPEIRKEPVMDGGNGGGPVLGPDGKPLKDPKGGK